MYKNGIYGAVIGDICGSFLEVSEMRNKTPNPNERIKILNKDFPLFNDNLFYTDDTILTCALCQAILDDKDYSKYIKLFGKREIDYTAKNGKPNKFGKLFTEWCNGSSFNQSFGNGCAMRISPVGFFAKNEKELEENVIKATICTHNHPDSIKTAMATGKAIFMAKNNSSKQQIKNMIEKELGFTLDFDIKNLQQNYTFTAKAINSVPQALFCFLQAKSFDETIRLALSMGGDTDTNAAIAGSVAGAYYGIENNLVNSAKKYLPTEYIEILDNFNEKITDLYDNKEEL